MQGGLLPGPGVCTRPDTPLKSGVLASIRSKVVRYTPLIRCFEQYYEQSCYQARQDCWLCFAVQDLPLLADSDEFQKLYFQKFISPAAVVAATQELSSCDTLAKCSLKNHEMLNTFWSYHPKKLKKFIKHCPTFYFLAHCTVKSGKTGVLAMFSLVV